MRGMTKLVRLVNTHGNVVIFSSFVRGGNMCQVLNDLFCVFCLTGSRLTSAKQSNKTIQIKQEPEKTKTFTVRSFDDYKGQQATKCLLCEDSANKARKLNSGLLCLFLLLNNC